ncbi:MAG: hypothetical protein Q9175_004061 [Cornicularia normoerica]
MHPTNILQLALLAASQVVAAPTEPASQPYAVKTLLGKRADPAPVTCGPPEDERAWPLQSVQNSFNALVENAPKATQDRPRAGNRYYPRRFGNPTPSDPEVVVALDAIPECKTGQAGKGYSEFPLLDPVFTGGATNSQGLDRVLAISGPPAADGTVAYTYCLAFTHRGHTGTGDGAVVPCVNAP